jgi:CopG antitoxin of type II toxin-antitoxin system
VTQTKKIPLRAPSDVPTSMSDEEARAFWDSHEVTDEYIDRAGTVRGDALPPTRPDGVRLAFRLSEDVVRRVKALARKKRRGYRTLIAEFIDDRLREEERREGHAR